MHKGNGSNISDTSVDTNVMIIANMIWKSDCVIWLHDNDQIMCSMMHIIRYSIPRITRKRYAAFNDIVHSKRKYDL